MKKLLSLLLTILIILSFSSCSEKPVPTARELLDKAMDITADYRMETTIGAVAVIDGEPSTLTAIFDSNVDEDENIHVKYTIAMPTNGMNMSGNMYIFPKELEFYIQVMGIWVGFRLDELYEFPADYEEQVEDMQKQYTEIINKAYEDGQNYSDVTETEDSYIFTLTANEKTKDYIIEILHVLFGRDEEMMSEIDAILEEYSWVTDIVTENLSEEHTFDKKTLKPKESYMNLTPMANEIIGKITEDIENELRKEINDYTSTLVNENEVIVNNLSVDIKYSDYGNVSPVTLDENIKTMARNYLKTIYSPENEFSQ